MISAMVWPSDAARLVRQTAVAELGEYAVRLLEATLGRHHLLTLVDRYRAEVDAPGAATEAGAAPDFLAFLQRERAAVPYLDEVVAFERAAAGALGRETETTIYFSCRPVELFRALLLYDRPAVIDRRRHAVHVGPRGLRIEGPI